MLLGTLALWVGVPLLWVLAGSLVKGWTGSTGLSLLVMLTGAAATIALLVRGLLALSARRSRQLAGSGDPYGSVALEAFMAIGAVAATVGFGVWWLFLA